MKITIEQLEFPMDIKNKNLKIKSITKLHTDFIAGKNIIINKTNIAIHEPHKNVEPSVALNVIRHLAISIGKYSDNEMMGKSVITDKSGIDHTGIRKFPFIITKVKAGKFKIAIDTAKANPNLLVVDYPKDMLDTRTDDELVSSIESKENDKLDYLGAIIYANKKDVNEIASKFQLWNID